MSNAFSILSIYILVVLRKVKHTTQLQIIKPYNLPIF